jgi:hypothetical protein
MFEMTALWNGFPTSNTTRINNPVTASKRYTSELKYTIPVHRRALIKQRRVWYKMESREVPPFLFAYLGRRSARFIRNRAGIVPLTGFLCVYPKIHEKESLEKLWRLLNHPDTLANLHRVAKSYGSGAIKVEPRALEKVPLSERALSDCGLAGTSKREPQMAFHLTA